MNLPSDKIAIFSFYKFVNIDNPEILLPKLLYHAKRKNIKGTILIANEGINGSITGQESTLEFLINEIMNHINVNDLQMIKTYADYLPFNKLKIKLKPEIITLGIKLNDINHNTGTYIEATEWDNFITKPDVVVIDTRNIYEIKDGTFKDSINPYTETFRQFPEWAKQHKDLFKNKKIAMFCTGGVRCEKSTTYLRNLGFNDVYHLKGGILRYLADTQNKNNLWEGDCFVFDERKTLTNELLPAMSIS